MSDHTGVYQNAALGSSPTVSEVSEAGSTNQVQTQNRVRFVNVLTQARLIGILARYSVQL